MPPRSKIDVLCHVSKVGSRYLFAGWDEEGLPTYTTLETDLSATAQEALEVFVQSKSEIPRLNVSSGDLKVAVASFVGQIVDMKDTSPDQLAVDSIKITVTDSRGKEIELKISELDVLSMIAKGMVTFQNIGTMMDTVNRQVAVESFSFLLPASGNRNSDVLLLIKPTNENVGNLIDTILLVSEIIKKLIDNDRRQPQKYRKGYLEAQSEAEKEKAKEDAQNEGLLDFFFVPAGKEKSKTGLKDLLTDIFYEPATGSTGNPFLVPVEKKKEFSEPTKDNLGLLRMIATKMYLHARNRIER